MIHYWPGGTALNWFWWCGVLHHKDFTGNIILSHKVKQHLKRCETELHLSSFTTHWTTEKTLDIFSNWTHITWIGSYKMNFLILMCPLGYLNLITTPSEGSSHADICLNSLKYDFSLLSWPVGHAPPAWIHQVECLSQAECTRLSAPGVGGFLAWSHTLTISRAAVRACGTRSDRDLDLNTKTVCAELSFRGDAAGELFVFPWPCLLHRWDPLVSKPLGRFEWELEILMVGITLNSCLQFTVYSFI